MSKRSAPDARRQELIDATAGVLATRGAAGASVRAIAAAAGVSPGLVTHHFGGVDRLVEATYDQVAARVGAALEQAVAAAGNDPGARLAAYVEASFAPPIADAALLATWIAFWSLVPAHPAIRDSHLRHYAGYRARLEALLLADGIGPARVRHAAIAVTALVDGLWLELCLAPGSFDADDARAMTAALLAALRQRDRSVNSDT